ncbi:MAG TPA: hypothetical protein VHB79_37595 [Polyangiaceae bacterium]|nr:hypothetical protein [Polyangiaceae bacterium]
MQLRPFFSVALSAWMLSAVVAAEPSETAGSQRLAAESAFAEGVKLLKLDRCAEAIDKFRYSQRLEPASGTLLNLGYCQARLGLIASAWLSYRSATPLAEEAHKGQHEQIAREQAERLEPQLPRLTLAPAGGVKRDLRIELDGQALGPQADGVSLPVDPGPHVVVATLENGVRWERSLTIALAEKLAIEIPLPDAEPSTRASPAMAPESSGMSPPKEHRPQPARVEPPVAPHRSDWRPTRPVWALGLTLTGAAAAVTGTALFVSARVAYDDARRHCTSSNECERTFFEREESAARRAKISGLVFGGGLLLGGVGAYFYTRPLQPRTMGRREPILLMGGSRDWLLGYRETW